MLNFKEDILLATEGEVIQSVVILAQLDTVWQAECFHRANDPRDTPELLAVIKKPISWETAAPLLDYPFDAGYGMMDCHAVVIYTDKSIYFVHEYDGSTCLHSVYREPSSCEIDREIDS